MRRGLNAQGFTIAEVLIVLAVTGFMFVLAAQFINGRQQKTEFTQSIHDMQTQVDQIIGNVQNGFYPGANTFTCTDASGGAPQVTSVVGTQGQNQGCIFLGRAMQFNVNGKPDKFNVYNMIGQEFNPATSIIPTTDLTFAHPIALSTAPSNPVNAGYGGPDTTEYDTTQYGLKAATMQYVDTTGTYTTNTVAFLTDLGQAVNSTNGTQNVILYGLKDTGGTVIIDMSNSAQNTSDHIVNALYDTPSNFIKADEVDICFEGGINQNATLTIGGNSRGLSTTLSFGTGNCP